MEYKEQSKVDVHVTCSECGAALSADTDQCTYCAPSTTSAPLELSSQEASVTPEPATHPVCPPPEKIEKKVGAGVFFRSRLLVAITTVLLLTAGIVYAIAGEDLPFLWAMATLFMDTDKDQDHRLTKIANSASPHNRPFFLMFTGLVRQNQTRSTTYLKEEEGMKRATLTKARQDCLEAANLFDQRHDPRMAATGVVLALCSEKDATDRDNAHKDLARLADYVCIHNDLPKSGQPRMFRVITFGSVNDPYEYFTGITPLFTDQFTLHLYEHIFELLKDEPDGTLKKNSLSFAYASVLQKDGEKEKASQVRRKAIAAAESHHLTLSQTQLSTIFKDIVEQESWDDAIALFKQPQYAANAMDLAFCYFAAGRDAEAEAVIKTAPQHLLLSDVRNGYMSRFPKTQALTVSRLYEAILRLHPQYSIADKRMIVERSVWCRAAAQDKKYALTMMNQARFLWQPDPNDTPEECRNLTIHRAALHLICGDTKTARTLFQKLRKDDEENKQLATTDDLYLAFCDARAGDANAALSALDRLDKDTDVASYGQLAKANLLAKLGRFTEAEKVLTTLCKTTPPLAVPAREKLAKIEALAKQGIPLDGEVWKKLESIKPSQTLDFDLDSFIPGNAKSFADAISDD